MTGESMTVTGTEVREEVAKVWPTTAKAVIGQSATTGTLFLPRKSRAVAMTAERVERTGEEVERETERWQSTRLVKSSAQPSGEETMVVWILRSEVERSRWWPDILSYQLTPLGKYFDRSGCAPVFMSSTGLPWVPLQQR